MWAGKPFQVHPSELPLTAPSEVPLATDARAHEREEFDEHIKEKWQQIEVGWLLARRAGGLAG
jgi:hypothetical protein